MDNQKCMCLIIIIGEDYVLSTCVLVGCVYVLCLCVCCMQVHYARVGCKIHVCNKLFNRTLYKYSIGEHEPA